MIGLPLGRCRNCEGPVSHFARRCPSCLASNLPNPIAITVALVAAALVGGLATLGNQVLRGGKGPQIPAHGDATPSASDPAANSSTEYGWIVQAMAECEEEAKIKTDTMHFLIVPVTPTGMLLPGWSPEPITAIGNSVMLLNSTDALIGLRNHVLALYQKPLTFAFSDPSTQTVFKWKPATGVTALKTRETGLASLTLGFEIPDVTKEMAWGPTITHTKGSCYWINPLVRSAPRSG